MGWALGGVVYFTIWWTMFTAVLPFWVKSQREAGEVVPGSDPGAPAVPHIGRKMLLNCVVSAVIWIAVDLGYMHFYLGSF